MKFADGTHVTGTVSLEEAWLRCHTEQALPDFHLLY